MLQAFSANYDATRRERLLMALSATTFLIFFQAYMVAPLIPRLSAAFGTSAQQIGLLIPAYMIPYGVSTLFFGLLSDRIGRRRIMFASLWAFVILTVLTATAHSASQMIAWRFLTGLGASGVVPLALALMGSLFPYEQRGRPLGWLFGAMAGGAAFGSAGGVIIEPWIGCRMLFVSVGATAALIIFLLARDRALLGEAPPGPHATPAQVFAGYRELLASARGARTYSYVLVNAVFHSGVFTWLGFYFQRRYALDEMGIGLALLGYGVPGFLFGPIIGRAADRWGRRWLIALGIILAAVSAAALIPNVPLWQAKVAVVALSLGYDMTQPLLAGIVTALGGKRAGQAMGLNVFMLFTGFGVGSYLFGEALRFGFASAFAAFAAVQLLMALAAIPLFSSERTIQR